MCVCERERESKRNDQNYKFLFRLPTRTAHKFECAPWSIRVGPNGSKHAFNILNLLRMHASLIHLLSSHFNHDENNTIYMNRLSLTKS